MSSQAIIKALKLDIKKKKNAYIDDGNDGAGLAKVRQY